jgi:hypothetical protein
MRQAVTTFAKAQYTLKIDFAAGTSSRIVNSGAAIIPPQNRLMLTGLGTGRISGSFSRASEGS